MKCRDCGGNCEHQFVKVDRIVYRPAGNRDSRELVNVFILCVPCAERHDLVEGSH